MSSDRIEVLYLTHNYPRGAGDFAGRFVARLAELIGRRGTPIAVLAPHHAGAAESETDGGIRVHRFRYAADADEIIAYRGELGKIGFSGNTSPFAYRRFWRSFTSAATTLTKQYNPRVIHAHWWIPAGMIARKLDFNGPLVVTLHGTDLRLLQRKAWLRPFASRVLKRASVVTLVSSWLAASLESIFPWLAPKIQITPMPPNDDVFTPADGDRPARAEPVVLSVTRFTDQKRNKILVESLANLRQRGIACHLRLIGEGPLREDVAAQIRQAGLGESVEILAPIPQTGLADEYRNADVVVLPAVDEGFGMALVEAQFCGTTVVGVRSGGLTDIITDDETGLLAAPDDPADLATVLARALGDQTLRERLGRRGMESARTNYSSMAIVDKFCNWYNIDQ